MADLTLARPRPPAALHARLGRALGRPLARPIELAALALLLAFAARLRWLRLDTYTGSFDEGIRSQQLLLMSAGYRPFRDIFSSQGPLLLDLLYPFFALLGGTLEAARSGVAVMSMVGLIGAWWAARAVAGPITGLAAVVILALSPGYLENSRLALAEVPTIAPALLAVGALLTYRANANRRWLVLSATSCAIAVLIKPMVVHVGAPLLLLLGASGSGATASAAPSPTSSSMAPSSACSAAPCCWRSGRPRSGRASERTAPAPAARLARSSRGTSA